MQGGYFKTKRVHIFVNGRDQYKSFNIHPRSRQGWSAILDCFSRALKPPFGAIRVLRTRDGRKIVDNFDDLEHEGKYIACGLEAYRCIRGGYRTNSEMNLKLKSQEYYPADMLSTEDQKKYPCLIETMRKGRTLIYVFANGRKTPPKKVVLIKSDYKAWDSILTHLGHILDIPEGVRGMCTVFGQPLCSPYEIQHGGYYVAIPFNTPFKQIKYLPARRVESYHEESPMVTKAVYIAAAKTCTSIEGFTKKRKRKRTTKVRESSGERNTEPCIQEKQNVQQQVKIEGHSIRKKVKCVCVGEGTCPNIRKKLHKVQPNQNKPTQYYTQYSPGKSEQHATVESISGSERPRMKDDDVDIMEDEIGTIEYTQKNDFTQTSALFFEARYDEDNSILLNKRRYYLIPEEEMEDTKFSSKANWYSDLSHPRSGDSSRLSENVSDENERTRIDEVKKLAGSIIGVIINASEMVANRTIFGRGTSPDISHTDNMIGKPSLIPDTLQPKSRHMAQPPNHEARKSALYHKEGHQQSKEKILRLSLPIGRGSRSGEEESSSAPDPLNGETVGHSSAVEIFEREFTPLTPSHDMKYIKYSVMDDKESSHELLTPHEYEFIRLRRDSVGIPLIKRKPKLVTESPTDEEVRALPVEHQLKPEEHFEEEEEWKKLDILDDFVINIDQEEDDRTPVEISEDNRIEDITVQNEKNKAVIEEKFAFRTVSDVLDELKSSKIQETESRDSSAKMQDLSALSYSQTSKTLQFREPHSGSTLSCEDLTTLVPKRETSTLVQNFNSQFQEYESSSIPEEDDLDGEDFNEEKLGDEDSEDMDYEVEDFEDSFGEEDFEKEGFSVENIEDEDSEEEDYEDDDLESEISNEDEIGKENDEEEGNIEVEDIEEENTEEIHSAEEVIVGADPPEEKLDINLDYRKTEVEDKDFEGGNSQVEDNEQESFEEKHLAEEVFRKVHSPDESYTVEATDHKAVEIDSFFDNSEVEYEELPPPPGEIYTVNIEERRSVSTGPTLSSVDVDTQTEESSSANVESLMRDTSDNSRRKILNAWDEPAEDISKEKLEVTLDSTKPLSGDYVIKKKRSKPMTPNNSVNEFENFSDSTSDKREALGCVEEERRLLINFLKKRIDSALRNSIIQ